MNNSLLWKCIPDDGPSSYVFGTMHVRDHQAFGALDHIKEKIIDTECYYSELQMELTDVSQLDSFQRLPDGQSFKDLIPGKKYKKLRDSILKSFQVDIQFFDHYYPLIISNLIQTSILSNQSDTILDFRLYEFAKQQGKELRYLESQNEQLEIFRQIPLEYQIKALISLGEQPYKAKKQLGALLNDYADANTRQLYRRTQKQLGKLRHRLLYERNIKMAEKLAKELRTVSAFVGVGAAHLFGYKGILRLLKQAGYRLYPERISE